MWLLCDCYVIAMWWADTCGSRVEGRGQERAHTLALFMTSPLPMGSKGVCPFRKGQTRYVIAM